MSEFFPPKIIGGGELSAYYLAKYLQKGGHEVFVLTSRISGQKEVEVLNGVKIHRILLHIGANSLVGKFLNNEPFFLYSGIKATRFIKRFKIDVIHAMNVRSIPGALMAARLTKIPVVATMNSYWGICPTGDLLLPNGEICSQCTLRDLVNCLQKKSAVGRRLLLPALLYTWYYKIMRIILMKRLDSIIAVSSAVKQELSKLNVKQDKIYVVPNLIDIEEFKGKRETSIKIKKHRDEKIVLYVGSFSKHKGVECLIRAVPKIAEQIPKIKLILVGRANPYSKSLEELVQRLDITNLVEFTGYVPNNELFPLYKQADVIVHPSIYPDPLSRVLLEAIATQKPIIATKIGGAKDVIKHGVNGLLIDQKSVDQIVDAVRAVLSDKKLVKRFSEESEKVYKNSIHWKAIVDKIIRIYEGLLANAGFSATAK